MRTPARMLAAATLTVLTVLPAGVAQAGAADEPGQRVLERTLAREHHAVASQQQPTALEQFRRGERASQEQPTTDAALRRVLAQEHSYSFRGYSDTPAPAPDEPSGQPDWLVLGLGVLTAAMALSTGMAVLAARRANRRVRAGQRA